MTLGILAFLLIKVNTANADTEACTVLDTLVNIRPEHPLLDDRNEQSGIKAVRTELIRNINASRNTGDFAVGETVSGTFQYYQTIQVVSFNIRIDQEAMEEFRRNSSRPIGSEQGRGYRSESIIYTLSDSPREGRTVYHRSGSVVSTTRGAACEDATKELEKELYKNQNNNSRSGSRRERESRSNINWNNSGRDRGRDWRGIDIVRLDWGRYEARYGRINDRCRGVVGDDCNR